MQVVRQHNRKALGIGGSHAPEPQTLHAVSCRADANAPNASAKVNSAAQMPMHCAFLVRPQRAQPNASGALDVDAYIRCRATTEALRKRTRPVLYTNRKGFFFYTAQGARLARDADALSAACPTPDTSMQSPDQREKSGS